MYPTYTGGTVTLVSRYIHEPVGERRFIKAADSHCVHCTVK